MFQNGTQYTQVIDHRNDIMIRTGEEAPMSAKICDGTQVLLSQKSV